MAWIEQVAARTAKATVYTDSLNPRRHRLVASIHDVHFHDGAAWQDCDESIVDDTTTGFAHKCDRLRHIIRIATTGTRRWIPRRDHPNEYIEFGRLQSWTGSAWANVNLGTPTRNANSISWDTTNFSLKLTNNWHRVKILVVLKTEAARRRLRWAVSLVGLEYEEGTLTSESDSTIVGHVEKPVAWDANAIIRANGPVPNVTISTTYSGGFLEFGGDLSAAVLPITIDPTLTSQPDDTAGLDCDIDSSAPDTNFNTANLYIGDIGGTEKMRPLIHFTDLDSVDDSSTVNSATLSLYMASENSFHDRSLSAYKVKRDWVETQATWNSYSTGNSWQTAGGTGVNDYDSVAIGAYNLGIDEAVGVKDITLSGATIGDLDLGNGWLLLLTVESSDFYQFLSSDTGTAAQRPKLVVDYTEAGGTAHELAATCAITTTTSTPVAQAAHALTATLPIASTTSTPVAQAAHSLAASAAIGTTTSTPVAQAAHALSATAAIATATSSPVANAAHPLSATAAIASVTSMPAAQAAHVLSALAAITSITSTPVAQAAHALSATVAITVTTSIPVANAAHVLSALAAIMTSTSIPAAQAAHLLSALIPIIMVTSTPDAGYYILLVDVDRFFKGMAKGTFKGMR